MVSVTSSLLLLEMVGVGLGIAPMRLTKRSTQCSSTRTCGYELCTA